MPVTTVTKTKLRVKNVEPNQYVHGARSRITVGDPLQGGGHYKHEPTPDTIEANEIDIFTSDDDVRKGRNDSVLGRSAPETRGRW